MVREERVVVFIDGSNLYHILKDMFHGSKHLIDFNFEKFVEGIVGSRRHVMTYYYTAPLDRKKDESIYVQQQKFFDKLNKMRNFKLILCRMQKVRIDGKIIYQVKEDDIHLAADMVKLAYNDVYDTCILVSSDGDFVPAILAAKEKGKKVENIGFKTKFSYHLKQVCDGFRMLNKEEAGLFFS